MTDVHRWVQRTEFVISCIKVAAVVRDSWRFTVPMAMAVIERVPERWSDRGKIDEKGRERQSGCSLNCHSARLINALQDSAAPWLRQRTVEIQFRPVTFVLENVMFIKYDWHTSPRLLLQCKQCIQLYYGCELYCYCRGTICLDKRII